MKYVDPTGEFVIPLAIPVLPAIGTVIAKGVALAGVVIVGLALGDAASKIINGESQEESPQSPSPLIDSAVSPAGAMPPSPDDDEGDENSDYYESSSKHHQNAKGNVSQEPQNAAEMFDRSVKEPNKPNTRWYRDKDGVFHRFQGSNHKYHWNGSTKTGTRMESIPIEIRRNLPSGDL